MAQLGLAFLFAGLLLAVVQTLVLGHVTDPALGLGVIGATLFCGAVGSMLVAVRRFGGEDSDGDDDPGGGGGPVREPEPPAPSGGIEVDWDRFERDFRAYAERVTRGRAAAGGRR